MTIDAKKLRASVYKAISERMAKSAVASDIAVATPAFERAFDELLGEHQKLGELINESYDSRKSIDVPTTKQKTEPVRAWASKQIYREISKQTHPDIHGETFGPMFSSIAQAYSTGDEVYLHWLKDILSPGHFETLSPEDSEKIMELSETESKKTRIEKELMANSYQLRWSNAKNTDEKNKILLDYAANILGIIFE